MIKINGHVFAENAKIHEKHRYYFGRKKFKKKLINLLHFVRNWCILWVMQKCLQNQNAIAP